MSVKKRAIVDHRVSLLRTERPDLCMLLGTALSIWALSIKLCQTECSFTLALCTMVFLKAVYAVVYECNSPVMVCSSVALSKACAIGACVLLAVQCT